MPTVERQITINAPASEVFSYLSDLTKHPEWAQHNIRVEKTSEGDVSVGSTFRSGHVEKGLRDQVTITELESNSRIVFESDGPEGHHRHAFLLRDEDGGTRLTKRYESIRLPFKYTVLLPVLPMMVGRYNDKDLGKIKANLESRSD